MPNNRPGLGDDPGRRTDDPQGRGYIEWRWTPAYGVEIVNIEVGNAYRRQGVGRLLLERLLEECGEQLRTVYAITRASNLIAVEWYAAMGFHIGGTLNGFYDGDPEMVDAILFAKVVRR